MMLGKVLTLILAPKIPKMAKSPRFVTPSSFGESSPNSVNFQDYQNLDNFKNFKKVENHRNRLFTPQKENLVGFSNFESYER